MSHEITTLDKEFQKMMKNLKNYETNLKIKYYEFTHNY